MNNLKILLHITRNRSVFVVATLFFLSIVLSSLSVLSSSSFFAPVASAQAVKEAPAPGVELPQFDPGQAPAVAQGTESAAGTTTAVVEEEEVGPVQYRTFFGLDSRVVVWIVSELHLM
ncbi:MAG: hypothetical protein AAB331_03175, partial [Planctomycetota bacterium]